MKTITLLGASGAIGKSIADALNRAGIEYRVVGRDRSRLDSAFGGAKLAVLVIWNPGDPDSARSALHGSDPLVYMIGVPYNQFQLHPILMRRRLTPQLARTSSAYC